jgi:hypothetical protein
MKIAAQWPPQITSGVTNPDFPASHLRRFTPLDDFPAPHYGRDFRLTSRSSVARPMLAATILFSTVCLAPSTNAQNAAPNPSTPAACPVQFVRFNPSGVSVRVKNTSGKDIVGLVFNAALADATEHWIWLHWNFDATRPIRNFGWNKLIKPDAAKTLSWYREDIDFEHGGGGAFVLTSALFADGSTWEESLDGASCKYVWFNSHKKNLTKPLQLPFRQ